ncbi:MAG: HepT-like ribonuclease domain-containing protein [Cyanobacteria bacterium P01_D01_bin.14]
MKEKKADATYLWHMVKASQNIRTFTEALSFEDYAADIVLVSAVERQFEILGEAARRVSEELKAEHSDITWQKIIDLRNVIIHQYERIDQDIIWNIIFVELPRLEERLRNIVKSMDAEDQ